MKQVFQIVPAGAGPLWVAVAIGGLLFVLVAAFGYFAWSSRHVQFEITSSGLSIVGDMYGRSIASDQLDLERARAVDLTQDKSLAPSLRTNGAGLPGYSAGWFRLKNGEKALLFVTDKSHVVYIPTREGYAVLLSVDSPEQFLEALRSTIASPQESS